MRRWSWVCVLLAAAAAPAVHPLRAAGKVGPKPAPGAKEEWTGAKEERWLAYIVDDELRRGRGPAAREALRKRLAEIVLAWAGCGRLEQFGVPVQIVRAMRACRHLAVLEAAGDEDSRQLAQWLADHEDVRRILFRALDDVPSPSRALKAFRHLQAYEPEKVVAYPNLAAAFATAGTLRFYKAQPDRATMLESFLYYTDPGRRFRYNLKKMPFELSRYLADTRLAVAERTWAAQRYARTRNLPAAYHHVRYDHAHYRENKPKKISKLPYTLANLRRVGGVCVDQAYYASEVCKALGVPATVVYGRGVSGVGHAWFKYFQMDPARTTAAWRDGAGRYASELYFTGTVIDPAAGERMLDSELAILGSAALLPLRRREEAEAAVVLAKLVAAAWANVDKPADPTPLRQLAFDYEKRLAGRPGAPKLRTAWIEARRKIDRALVEGLIDLAIQRNLAHAPAWHLILRLRRSRWLPVESLNRFLNVLIDKTARTYPELSCHVVLRLVPTLPAEAGREKAYKRALAVYGRRPDLKGRILLAMGDERRKLGQNVKAIRIYQAAATQCIQAPDIALRAAARAEDLLLAEEQPSAAVRMYSLLFGRTRKEADAAEEVRRETPHYRLGTRLAELLRRAGKTAAADRVLSSL